jgi:hemolysin III
VLAFGAAAPVGHVLVLNAKTGAATVRAAVFAASVTAMLGASSLLHRRRWSAARRRWIAALDHAMIYVLIAGTYTFTLLGRGRVHGRSAGEGTFRPAGRRAS